MNKLFIHPYSFCFLKVLHGGQGHVWDKCFAESLSRVRYPSVLVSCYASMYIASIHACTHRHTRTNQINRCLCFQAVVRWLSKTDSGVSGLSNTDVRTEIVSFIRKMKLCTTVCKMIYSLSFSCALLYLHVYFYFRENCLI